MSTQIPTTLKTSPITLKVKHAVMKNKGSRLAWAEDVEITGFNADGTNGLLKKSSYGLSVRGGRYSKQIDFDANLGKGEGLNLDFGGTVRQLSVALSCIEIDDGKGLPETGLWRAYGADGSQVAMGKLDPTTAKKLGDSRYQFAISAQKDIAKLTIEATGYGNGAGAHHRDNNSDFRLESITYSRVGSSAEIPTNKQPVAISDKLTTREDTSVVFSAESLLNNDRIGDGPTTITKISSRSAKGGSIVQKANGKYRYKPAADFFGKDRFKYSITDANGDTSSTSVTVNVKKALEATFPITEPRRVDLKALPHYLDGTNSTQQWGSEIRLSANGFDGRRARVSYYERKSDKGFGVISPKDRAKQIDFYHNKGSEKLNLAFDTLVGNVVLTVGMVGVNEDNSGFDETGKWTALDVDGDIVKTGLIGPDKSSLGAGVKVTDTYGQYPIEINAPSPFAELVIEATGFGHGKGEPTQQKYGENNSDFNITAISFDVISGTQGGF